MDHDDDDSLRPTAGARFALVRRDESTPGFHDASARYEARIVTPDASETFAIAITTKPAVAVAIEPTAASAVPAWTFDHLRSVARGIGRASARGEAWPRRLLRWRDAKV